MSPPLRGRPIAGAIVLAIGLAGCRGGGGAGDAGDEGGSGGADAGSDAGGSADDGGGDPTGGDAAQPGAMTRRLSKVELANTYQDVVGFVPEALGRLPPDQLDHDFDRIAQSQTVSALHLDALFAISDEIAMRMIAEGRLDQLSASCPDAILPPAFASTTTTVSAPALAAAPDWAYSVIDADTIMLQYAELATVSTSVGAPAPGRYRLTLPIEVDEGASTVSLTIDGAAVEQWSLADGSHEVVVEVDREATGTFAPSYDMSGAARFYVGNLTVEGPLDLGAETDAEARAACGHDVLPILAERAYRRPPTGAELDTLAAVFDAGAAGGGFADGLRMATAVIFGDPSFLYLVEIGTEDPDTPGLYQLGDHELASRLSYALCQGPPDAELRADADAGVLTAGDALEQHARRLLAEPCARTTLLHFYRQWLWLDRLSSLMRDPEAFPQFTAAMGLEMLADAEAFLGGYTFDEPADWGAFFTAREAWVAPQTAALWGVDAPASRTRVDLPPERLGLLTHPAVMAATGRFAETAPVIRGKFVLEQLLCQSLPSPPTNVDITPPPPDPDLTTKERWQAHSADPSCAACHTLIDPIGFALEEYDALGVHRTNENGKPIDTAGGIPALGLADGELHGGVELAEAIAASDELRTCFARQWLRFGLGRLDDDRDAALREALRGAVDDSVQAAVLELVRRPEFRQRLPGDDP